MIITIYTILIYLLKMTFESNEVKAYGGNYGNIFKFIIYGPAKQVVSNSTNIKVNLNVSERAQVADCSVKDTAIGAFAKYSCSYEANINKDKIYILKEQEGDFGINLEDNMEIKPFNLTIEYSKAFHLQFIDNIWQYDLSGKLNDEIVDILLESLTYMNIEINSSDKIAGCILTSKNSTDVTFSCRVNGKDQSMESPVFISKTNNNYLKFNNELKDDDKYILVDKSLSFIKSEKLFYNNNSRWEFIIKIQNYSIPNGSKSIIDILYNGTISQATCFCHEPSSLKCYADKEIQTEYDLIKIQFIKSPNSTITWEDLTYVYEIPIEKELDFVSVTDLSSSSKLWKYKINFENGILPVNGLVRVDFIIEQNLTYANCYYFDSVLNCETSEIKNSSLILLSSEKKYGSIEWRNMNKGDNLIIPVNLSINYIDSYNLTFIENAENTGAWNFYIKLEILERIATNWKIIIKIKYGEDKKLGNAFCSKISSDSDEFSCLVKYKNQQKNDSIIITAEDEPNLKWKNGFAEKYIPIETTIKITKVYDLIYKENKWEFKIETDTDLPYNSVLILDTLYNEIHPDTATCIYKNKILFCQRDSQSQLPNESLKINPIKRNGTIEISNKEIINNKTFPLTIEINFKKAYGKFFSDFWNFYIEIDEYITVPINSYVLLDILLNENKVTAKCEFPLENESKILFCFIDESINQTRKDSIIINFENDLGSIRWKNNISELNGTIEESNSEEIKFSLTDAYDMEFIKEIWRFKIRGIPDKNIRRGQIYIIEMIYLLLNGEYDTIAKCWSKEGGSKNNEIIFLCNVDYDNQIDEGSIKMKYIQSSKSNLKWIGKMNSNFQITLKTSLYLDKAYDLTFDESWKFKIDVYGGILPPGSKVIVEIMNGNEHKSINCNSRDTNNIICDTQISEKNTSLIKISEKRNDPKSVEWLEIEKYIPNVFLIFLNVDIYFIRVYYLIFINNTWQFKIDVDEPIINGSKLSVDILYGNLEATATCYSNNIFLICYVDIKEQNENVLVKLNHIKSEYTSISWKNLTIDEGIDLVTNLTFNEADNLRINENYNWAFDIFVSEIDNIPNYSKFIIDINYEYELKDYISIAICYLNKDKKKIYCETSLTSKYYLIKLNLLKIKDSTSSVTWNYNKTEITNNVISMNITANLNYINSTRITFNEINNIYYFIINIDNIIPINGEIIIIILIYNEPTTIICKAKSFYQLECYIPKEIYKNNTIFYIEPSRNMKATAIWNFVEKKKIINKIYYNIKGAFDKKPINETHVGFKIVTEETILYDDEPINVAIKYDNDEIIMIPCFVKEEFLFCTAPKSKNNFDFDLDLSEDNNNEIIWVNRETYISNFKGYPIITQSLDIDIQVNSFTYNRKVSCYEFSFQKYLNNNYPIFIVIDIIIGTDHSYAYCTYDFSFHFFICKTKRIDFDPNVKIVLSKNNTFGGVNLTNTDELDISLFFINASEIYDLYFENNMWNFRIILKNEVDVNYTNESKTLDILVGDDDKLANCTIYEKLLECQANLDNNALIQMNNHKKGEIKINNMKNIRGYNIPLRTSLKFISSYYGEYKPNKNFSFTLEAISPDTIPEGSLVYLNLLNNNRTEMINCYVTKNNNKKIILSCMTLNSLNQSSLILLTNNKSNNWSISWEPPLSSDQFEIPINTTLNVRDVDNLYFNSTEGKWSFRINLKEDIFIENSKIIIDLIYQSNNSNSSLTAVCRYHFNGNYFLCIPDKDNQSLSDSFVISKKKNNSTVEFKDGNNLEISFKSIYDIKINHAYDLYFNNESKWQFMIEATEEIKTNETERLNTLDITVSDSPDFAYCEINGKLIKCTVESKDQNINQLIKLSQHKKGEIKIINYDLDKDKIPLKITLEFISSNYEKYYYYEFPFKIQAYNYSIIPKGSIFSLDIIKDNVNEIIICNDFLNKNNTIILSCSYLGNMNINSVYKLNNNKSNYGSITWKYKIDENKLEIPLNATLEIINSTNKIYNSETRKWSFEIFLNDKDFYTYYLDNSKIIINLMYNKENETALCRFTYYYYNNVEKYKCKCNPDIKNQSFTDNFEISKIQENAILSCQNKNNFYCLRIINLYTINAFQIYDLNFNKGKWQFIIESKEEVKLNDINKNKTLDIEVSGNEGFANCLIDGKILNCEVDSQNQNDSQLIRLSYYKYGEIKINKIEDYRIPLKMNLTFQSANYTKNESYKLTFQIKYIKNSPENIPENSIFTIDVINDNNNELAICSVFSENLFLCQTKNNTYSLLKLSNNKTKYSSIFWNGKIDEEKLEMPLSATLDVKNCSFLYYNNTKKKWSFQMTLYNYNSYLENSKIILDLIFNNKNETATCRYRSNEEYKFICEPDINNQKINDSFSISTILKNSTVNFTTSSNLKIMDLIYIYNAQVYDLHYANGKWKFIIASENKIEAYYYHIIKTLDINIIQGYSSKKGLANCTIDGKKLNCEIISNNNSLIKLANHLDANIKIVYIPNNYYIPFRINLEFASANYTEYSSKKLTFYVNAKNNNSNEIIPSDSFFSIDITRNNKNEMAFCDYYNYNMEKRNLTLKCFTQNNVDENSIIKLSNFKSNYSSITWIKNIPDDKLEMPLSAYIYVKNCTFLYFNKTNNKWSFQISLQDGKNYNFLNNSKIIIDLIYNNHDSTACCRYNYYSEKKFLCVPDNQNQNINDSFNISNTMKKSTVILSTYDLRIFNLIFIYPKQIYDLYFDNGKWKFIIESENEIEAYNLTELKLLDIKINEANKKLAYCKITGKIINCELDSSGSDLIELADHSNADIKIMNIPNNYKIPLRINLQFLSANYTQYRDNILYFTIYANNINDSQIPINSFFSIDITRNNKNEIAFCDYYNYVIYNKNLTLKCFTQNNVADNSVIKLSNVKSNYSSITWVKKIPDDKLEMPLSTYIYVKNCSFLYFNEVKKKWSFEISLSSYGDYLNQSRIIIDLIYNNINSSATCRYLNSYYEHKFLCIPDYSNQNINDSFNISKLKNVSTVTFSNYNLRIINLIFINATQIYDLHYDDGKWKFTIESENKIVAYNLTEIKTLDINIENYNDFAYCKIYGKILNCTVDGNAGKLINLTKHSEGDIKIMNIKDYYIPLKINYSLNYAYYDTNDIYNNYNKKFYFYTQGVLNISKTIPSGSRFSLDITVDGKKEIAICKLDSSNYYNYYNYYSYNLNLSCETQNYIEQKSEILLTNSKSKYTSITLINNLSDNKKEIYLQTVLDISNIDNLLFDNIINKWSFLINFNDFYYYQENSKILVDILYNNKNSLAICRYNTNKGYKFICFPDIEYQTNTDVLQISQKINKGTVSFKYEYKAVFIFPSKFRFEKAHELLYNFCNGNSNGDECWIFKVDISEGNLTNNKATQINIKEGNLNKAAICTLNITTLYCKSYSNNQYNDLNIYNNKTSSYVKWINLDDEAHIYLDFYMTLLNSYGAFINNRWEFNIEMIYRSGNIKGYYYYNYALLDITYNSNREVAICKFGGDILNCIFYHDDQKINDIILIEGKSKPNLGTIYFSNTLYEYQKKLKIPEININSFYSFRNQKCNSNENIPLSFEILGYSNNDLTYKTVTEITVEKIYGDKKQSRAACDVKKVDNYYYNVILSCNTDNNFILSKDGAKISTNTTGYSRYVKFSYILETEKIICPGEIETIIPPTTIQTTETTPSNKINYIAFKNSKMILLLVLAVF